MTSKTQYIVQKKAKVRSKYEFTESEDYKVCFPKRESKKGSGGHNIKDYSLALDMAKELSMVEVWILGL